MIATHETWDIPSELPRSHASYAPCALDDYRQGVRHARRIRPKVREWISTLRTAQPGEIRRVLEILDNTQNGILPILLPASVHETDATDATVLIDNPEQVHEWITARHATLEVRLVEMVA